MQDRIFHTLIFGFAFGVLMRSYVDVGSSFAFFLILISVACVCLRLFSSEHENFPLFTYTILPIFLSAVAFGIFRYDISDISQKTASVLYPEVGKEIVFEGVVFDEPDIRDSGTHFALTVDEVQSEGRTVRAKTRALIFGDSFPEFSYGDRVEVRGILKRPESFMSEDGLREIDYPAFLAKDGIYFVLYRPALTLVSSGEGSRVVALLFLFKREFVEHISRIIPEPEASLLGGLLVGAKQSLGSKLLDDFRTVGIIHIIVLSGYNITIVAEFFMRIVGRLSRYPRLFVGSLAMIFFALMTGASATVVRATIMALLVVLARATARTYIVTRALLLAGFSMILFNPKILAFDVSFELSFLATVGLIYLSPIILPHVRFVTERLHMRDIVVATLATQLFVLPFLLYKTGALSIISLVVNLLVLAVIPLTMLLGFIAGLMGFFSTVLAMPFAFGAHALLSYILLVVDWFARLPHASVAFSSFPLWLALFCYLLYALVILRANKRKREVSSSA